MQLRAGQLLNKYFFFLPNPLNQADSCSLDKTFPKLFFRQLTRRFFHFIKSWYIKLMIHTQLPSSQPCWPWRKHFSCLGSQRSHFKPNSYFRPLQHGWVFWILSMTLRREFNTLFAIFAIFSHSFRSSSIFSSTEKKNNNNNFPSMPQLLTTIEINYCTLKLYAFLPSIVTSILDACLTKITS